MIVSSENLNTDKDGSIINETCGEDSDWINRLTLIECTYIDYVILIMGRNVRIEGFKEENTQISWYFKQRRKVMMFQQRRILNQKHLYKNILET